MKTKFKIIVVIIYLVALIANMMLVIDWDDLFLPTSLMVCGWVGCAGGEAPYYVYRKGLSYYIGEEPISRDEYKFIVSGLRESTDDSSNDYCGKIKYPFMSERNVYLKRNGLRDRVRLVLELHKENNCFVRSVMLIMEEFNCKSGYFSYGVGENRWYFGYGESILEGHDDRYTKIHRDYMTELANLRLYSNGRTEHIYPGINTDLMERYIEKNTGYSSEEIVKRMYIRGSFLFKESDYLNDDMKLYYMLRYTDTMFKGSDIVCFETKTYKGLTIVMFSIPGEKKEGVVEFDTHDPIKRQLILTYIKLAILADGKVPMIQGSYLSTRILMVSYVQNLILVCGYLCFSKKRVKL
ncbi:MAG: hypothetical protein J6U23_00725 [Clostridiales bacterium]|nr:hypothetical protein [Clostridiales bacterium]